MLLFDVLLPLELELLGGILLLGLLLLELISVVAPGQIRLIRVENVAFAIAPFPAAVKAAVEAALRALHVVAALVTEEFLLALRALVVFSLGLGRKLVFLEAI